MKSPVTVREETDSRTDGTKGSGFFVQGDVGDATRDEARGAGDSDDAAADDDNVVIGGWGGGRWGVGAGCGGDGFGCDVL